LNFIGFGVALKMGRNVSRAGGSSGLVTEINQSKTKLQRNRNDQLSEMPKLRLWAVRSWGFLK